MTPSIDGIICLVSQTSHKSSPPNNGKKKPNPSNDYTSQPTHNSGKTTKVIVIQTNLTDKTSKGKKKGKGKAKADTPKLDPSKPRVDDGSQCKPKYPCLICDKEHYTKDYP